MNGGRWNEGTVLAFHTGCGECMSKKYGMVYFNNFTNEDIVWALLALGKDADIVDTQLSRESTSEQDSEALAMKLREKNIDVAVTYDFAPALSDACMKLGIPYISWIFDAPIQMLYEKQVFNNCNYIFSFDKKQLRQLQEKGIKNTYYMPLGTNLMRNSAIEMTGADAKRFGCEVSFIGSLYSENAYGQAVSLVQPETVSEFERLIHDVLGKWDGEDRLYGKLSENTIGDIKRVFGNNTAMDDDALFTTALLVKHIATLERTEMLKRLSKHELQFYTSDSSVQIPRVRAMGPIDYIEELPKAYHFSRINMNITMRGITSGIPLRVFDIMGMEGFMLTNFQPEVSELFSPGKDIEVYHSFDEMEDKVDFYLSHEDERRKIARRGLETIKGNYTVEILVAKMLEIVG